MLCMTYNYTYEVHDYTVSNNLIKNDFINWYGENIFQFGRKLKEGLNLEEVPKRKDSKFETKLSNVDIISGKKDGIIRRVELEKILNEKEQNYLNSVIAQFRNNVKYIKKTHSLSEYLPSVIALFSVKK